MKCEAFSHLNVSGQKSGAARSHPGSFKADEAQMSKFNKKKRQRALRDLFHPIKPCLGLAIGRYIGESNHQAADCRPSEASLQLPWQANQGLLCHASRTMNWIWWVWWQDYPSHEFPTWKNLCSIGGKSPYKTIISQHFCGRHTVASLDDLRGFIIKVVWDVFLSISLRGSEDVIISKSHFSEISSVWYVCILYIDT